jgi:cyclohexanone monooxygenase
VSGMPGRRVDREGMTVAADDIQIDVEALERKYAEERAKRLRSDGSEQFQHLEGELAMFDHDPYAIPDFKRDPVKEDAEVVIIGAGFGGMLAGGRLRERGVEDIRIIDKAGDFGGTWYWNRYPGCACDVDATIYLPLLEETGYIPTEKYAKAPEIFKYSQILAKHFDLYRGALFQTSVTSATWDEKRSRWIVTTDRGDELAARFLISCNGFLTTPKLPKIPGISSFKGHMFHTSRWDFDYTKGDAYGGMTGLADKVVGILGTGSTGIQVIPKLGEAAKQLYVFQRTPSSIDVRGNKPNDPEYIKAQKPGWSREWRDNFTTLTSGVRAPVDYINDGWTDLVKHMPSPTGGEGDEDVAALAVAEMKKMELARKRIADTVKDPKTAEALKPWYHYFCKRPCFHDEYLLTYNRPNVTLVDTDGKGVERITPDGAVVAGKEYKLDCLIFATGFDFLLGYSKESGIEVVGENGLKLTEHWAHGPRTLYGTQTHGFPNFFFNGLPQAGVGINFVHTSDEQVKHIAYLIDEARKKGSATIQPTEQAQNAWVDKIMEGSEGRRAFNDACTPSYYNYEGKRDESYALNEFYVAGPMAYYRLLEEYRNAGKLEGQELKAKAA